MVNELVNKINELKKKRKAIILAHNYQLAEVQDIADFVGDSLGLSIEASKTEAEVIVFCGVYFMAETAKILSPHKTVLIPDKKAGCPMADMITAKQLQELKKKHPQAKVLCYVNTTAEVKAEADYCCTSANAINIVKGLIKDGEQVIFVPDKYLAHYVSTQTQKDFVYWDGYCPTHIKIQAKDIKEKKMMHPDAEVIVHPECRAEVIELADKVLSTEGMCKYAKSSKAKELIVGTETGLLYRLGKENPDKLFYPASEETICPNMKLTTLEKILWSLEDMKYEVIIENNLIQKARLAIDRMLQFSRVD
ncbi:MAG: quinolinate synthase NadA [Candidatus Omnitrophica bacterium]|nr:quinolinate synthase NadA [Candidatus Omnitrophota bacterium]